MKLVFKIAGGVFLGILAAFLLYAGVEMWRAHHVAEQLAESQQLESDRLKAVESENNARISKVAEHLRFTPEQIIERCGEPIRQYRGNYDGQPGEYLEYLGADGQHVVVTFACYGKSCIWDKIARVNRSRYEEEHPREYEDYFYTEKGQKETKYHQAPKVNQVRELPCVAEIHAKE
jgi:hypothetical protein